MKRLSPFFLMLWFILFTGQTVAAVTAEINPVNVQKDESFHLIITMDNAQASGVPDLTPLQRDFNILGTERSMTYTIVNGQARSVSQWSVLLAPKKTGSLEIPPIQIGQEQTQVMWVNVSDATVVNKSTDKPILDNNDVMFKTYVSESSPYINQQVIYTVRLYNSQQLLDADYQPPRVEDALLVPLGDGRRYQTLENNRSYHVEEQQYAVFPQKSGELQIIGPTFKALVYDSVPRRVLLNAERTLLTVKPMPAGFKGSHWFPAKQVTLTEEYDKSDNRLLQGNTLVRTVTLNAVAVPAQLLPSLSFSNSKQYNVYPDKPSVENSIRHQELVGSTSIKVTYMLNTAGQVTIPELNLPWFNTTTGKEKVASLPSRTLKIDANAQSAQQRSVNSAGIDNTLKNSIVDSQPTTHYMAWVLAGVFALAWLITLFLYWYPSNVPFGSQRRNVLNYIKQACLENNPLHAQTALMQWGRLHWPKAALFNLNDLIKVVHDPLLKKQLHLLSEVLYSLKTMPKWQGNELWICIKKYKHKRTRHNKGNGLPPINPV